MIRSTRVGGIRRRVFSGLTWSQIGAVQSKRFEIHVKNLTERTAGRGGLIAARSFRQRFSESLWRAFSRRFVVVIDSRARPGSTIDDRRRRVGRSAKTALTFHFSPCRRRSSAAVYSNKRNSKMSIFENLFDQLNVDGQTSLISALGWLLAIQRQLQNTSSDVNESTDVGNIINNVDFNSAENQNEAIS